MFDDLNNACAETFGEPATVRQDGQPDRSVTGIYDRRHYLADTDGPPLSSLHTSLTVVDATAGTIPVGALVHVRGSWHRVTDRRSDGQGMTVLVLEIVS